MCEERDKTKGERLGCIQWKREEGPVVYSDGVPLLSSIVIYVLTSIFLFPLMSNIYSIYVYIYKSGSRLIPFTHWILVCADCASDSSWAYYIHRGLIQN